MSPIPAPAVGILWCSECVSAVVTNQQGAALRAGITMWNGTVLCEAHYISMRGFGGRRTVDEHGVISRQEVSVAGA